MQTICMNFQEPKSARNTDFFNREYALKTNLEPNMQIGTRLISHQTT